MISTFIAAHWLDIVTTILGLAYILLEYKASAWMWLAGFTVYYMDYDNQLVQTGAQSDIGEPLTTNVKKSYRAGVELTAGCDITSWMTVEGNAALSLNKIKDFDERAAYNSFSDSPYSFRRMDAGLRTGCGLQIDMFYAELSYDLGLANICKDDFDTSKNGALMLSLGVNF